MSGAHFESFTTSIRMPFPKETKEEFEYSGENNMFVRQRASKFLKENLEKDIVILIKVIEK